MLHNSTAQLSTCQNQKSKLLISKTNLQQLQNDIHGCWRSLSIGDAETSCKSSQQLLQQSAKRRSNQHWLNFLDLIKLGLQRTTLAFVVEWHEHDDNRNHKEKGSAKHWQMWINLSGKCGTILHLRQNQVTLNKKQKMMAWKHSKRKCLMNMCSNEELWQMFLKFWSHILWAISTVNAIKNKHQELQQQHLNCLDIPSCWMTSGIGWSFNLQQTSMMKLASLNDCHAQDEEI